MDSIIQTNTESQTVTETQTERTRRIDVAKVYRLARLTIFSIVATIIALSIIVSAIRGLESEGSQQNTQTLLKLGESLVSIGRLNGSST